MREFRFRYIFPETWLDMSIPLAPEGLGNPDFRKVPVAVIVKAYEDAEDRIEELRLSHRGSISDLVARAHQNSKDKGFWDERYAFDPMHALAALMLIVTEVAEAAEELRNEDPFKHSGFSEELADICIRVFDLAGARGVDLESAIEIKMKLNESREHMHGKVA